MDHGGFQALAWDLAGPQSPFLRAAVLQLAPAALSLVKAMAPGSAVSRSVVALWNQVVASSRADDWSGSFDRAATTLMGRHCSAAAGNTWDPQMGILHLDAERTFGTEEALHAREREVHLSSVV